MYVNNRNVSSNIVSLLVWLKEHKYFIYFYYQTPKVHETPINAYELKIFYQKLFHFNSVLSQIKRPHFVWLGKYIPEGIFCFRIIYKTSKQWTKESRTYTHTHTQSEHKWQKGLLIEKTYQQNVHNNFLLFIFIYLYDVVVIL